MKSRSTKACEIPSAVKRRVYERDHERCVGCGRWCPPRCACAHYISRAHLGLGIEENIVTLCDECHRVYDKVSSQRAEDIGVAIFVHLRSIYGAERVKRENLIYSKWKGLKQ